MAPLILNLKITNGQTAITQHWPIPLVSFHFLNKFRYMVTSFFYSVKNWFWQVALKF